MQPTDHASTGKEYLLFPSNISGALYQSVSTSKEKVQVGRVTVLDSPKSAIFTFKSFVIRILLGFKSL